MLDDPWHSLVAGGIDARRVPNCRHDFFWIVSENSEPGLLLRLKTEISEARPLPRMRYLDIAYRSIAGHRCLAVFLKDREQRELFATLCADMVKAGETANDDQGALDCAIRRALRWHHLLRGGKSNQLTLDEQRGLIGELGFLAHLIRLVGLRTAIGAWKGPFGSPKDFELDGSVVEVKAKRGAARPFVQISSEDQLADVDGARLFLVVSPVDAVMKPEGKALTDHVAEIETLYSVEAPDVYALWEEAIAATGFDFDDDYSDRRWVSGKSLNFEVENGFPRVSLPLAAGVSGVRYSISLDACGAFAIDADELDQVIVERNGAWTS